MEMTDFQVRLNALMEREGVSKIQLAARAGMSRSAITQYFKISSKIPDTLILLKLAMALNTSVDYLLTGDERGKYKRWQSKEIQKAQEIIEGSKTTGSHGGKQLTVRQEK